MKRLCNLSLMLCGLCLASAALAQTPAPAPATEQVVELTHEQKQDQLFEQARQAVATGNYVQAVKLYTSLVDDPTSKHSQASLEYLGLARERLQQKAHAKALYEKYLKQYPEKNEDHQRVQQRLTALLTISAPLNEKLKAAPKASNGAKWLNFGSLSQYYRQDSSERDDADTVKSSYFYSSINHLSRRRSQHSEFSTRISAGNNFDLEDSAENDKTFTLNRLYSDFKHYDLGISARIGRQRRSNGGVLGRFDGLTLSYEFSERYQLHLATGYPVASTKQTRIDTNKHFTGLSLDMGNFAKAWSFNLFYIEQQHLELIDRKAVGGELRYFTAQRSLVTLLDYDIHFDELNTLLMTSHWTFGNQVTINTLVEQRNNPVLTSGSALIGQFNSGIVTFKDLTQTYSDDEIYQLAKDRTAITRNYNLGVSQPLGSDFQISADINLSTMGGTPESGNVLATPASTDSLVYTFMLAGSNTFIENDYSSSTFKYTDTDSAKTSSLFLSTRIPVTQNLRINPSLGATHRVYQTDNTKQETYALGLKIQYRTHKRYHLETDIRMERDKREITAIRTDQTDHKSVTLGYRMEW